MRFIRQEKIITTICDKEVEEDKYIVSLLQKLKEEAVYFTLVIKKVYQSDYVERTMIHDKVKVKDVSQDGTTADFCVFKDTSLFMLKGVEFHEISEIFALTEKINLLDFGREKSFFDYIDLED